MTKTPDDIAKERYIADLRRQLAEAESTEPHAPNPHAARLRTASRFEHDEGYAESLRLAADLIDAAVRWQASDDEDADADLAVAINALTTPRPGAEDA